MKFPKLVIEEANNLKKHATKAEIERLDFVKLDPHSNYSCIYGLMTGHCHNNRAVDLIKACAKRVYKSGDGFPHEHSGLNGSPVNLVRKAGSMVTFWSPIEVFISKQESGSKANKKLIQFIKGEIETL